ncbi:DEAD/DEAH box helicase [Rhodospirillales bacterium]|nr:DEAD/DEAH box helicase [Rhodospirillales bacterium]
MTEFEGVLSTLAQALNKRGYTTLTPVQQAIIAPKLKDADTLVSAQTGSGKTVAFGMAIAPTLLGDTEQFSQTPSPLALVVAPTRELALQVKRELEWLYEMTGAAFASCVGGMDMREERRALQRGAHIVVGTPGRLRDHIERGSFNTTRLKAVVLDEADEMLDLGFRDDLEHILDSSPKDRRTLMFSATVPRSIETLAKRYQRDAVRVETAAGQKQHLDIEYRALTVAPNDEENAIVNVLRYFDAKNALVFCSTRAAVNRITSRFNNRGFSVVALSGELSQNERTHALQAMRDGRARVCIATDVAARGIDLPNLELVIHADIPKNREILLHRSGRTGRAGRKGVCALIVPHNARKRTVRLLSGANIDAVWANPPTAEDVMAKDHERLLSDPSLTEPLSDIEKTFAEELLSRHSAEHVAAAFVRQYFAEQAAPEELLDTAVPERPPRQRDDFKNGVWFSLSVGRNESAEPRWLLPMLCRAGHITKHDIGAIRVQQVETFVELTPGCVEQFLTALGPEAKMENSIYVKQLEGVPDLNRGPREDRDSAPRAKKKPYSSDKPRAKKESSSETPFVRGDAEPRRKRAPTSGDKPEGKKPWDKSSKKPKNKKLKLKPGKSGGSSSKPSRADRAGSAPLKRKKPKT